ncbi:MULTISPECIES: hypothetical protein [unclassified Treponema]|uniref:hypothetical protein n=1 Tax=unclassified Treponema TaxID=2638727 RepID=UPI0020A34315|nr:MULTISPECIES: hypothetical protein [unclassified Treponema]UTC67036.1 hypothetical protein E4O06_14045 [Treponema sp. OMZ 789]UTC69767.1 hypothetical protein E4O01_14185 [Treponema sp. OMZ 790]UTC72481.1 hypothetical protein E4O02_14275 [Treponema sp. OMZ 791]
MKKFFFTLIFILSASVFIFGEDSDLGDFGFDDEEDGAESGVFSIDFGGAFYAGTEVFFETLKKPESYKFPFPLWGRLHLEARSPLAEAYASVNLNGKTLSVGMGEPAEFFPKPLFPRWIDEAYVQALTGPVVFGGGIKKINWGKAHFFSVLDTVNPKDFSLPYEFYPEKIKKSAPVFFLSAYLPKDMKLEFVYLPVFEADEFALNGRWQKNTFANLIQDLPASVQNAAMHKAKKTDTIDYAQGGLRYTFNIGGKHDLGFQYFTGFLHKPNFKSDHTPSDFTEAEFKQVFESAELIYNRYHQIGLDYEAMFGQFTVQAEFAANISNDLKGNNPDIYNPYIAWNLGLLYALPKNINLRLQAAETIRLLNSGINQNKLSLDTENGRSVTDTRLLFSLSQTLVRGSLEWKLNALVGIEDADFFINPELSWLIGTIDFDLGLGFFGGKKTGKLGRYQNNHFIKISIGYEF